MGLKVKNRLDDKRPSAKYRRAQKVKEKTNEEVQPSMPMICDSKEEEEGDSDYIAEDDGGEEEEEEWDEEEEEPDKEVEEPDEEVEVPAPFGLGASPHMTVTEQQLDFLRHVPALRGLAVSDYICCSRGLDHVQQVSLQSVRLAATVLAVSEAPVELCDLIGDLQPDEMAMLYGIMRKWVLARRAATHSQ